MPPPARAGAGPSSRALQPSTSSSSSSSASSSSGSAELRAVSRRFRRDLHALPPPASASGHFAVPLAEADALAAAFSAPSASASASAAAAAAAAAAAGDAARAGGKGRAFFRHHSRRTDGSSNVGTSTARESSPSVVLRGTPHYAHTPDVNEKVSAFASSEHDKWVIDPLSHQRRYWDLYILCLLLYVATVSVYVFSFLGVLNWSSPFFWIERAIDVSFLLDIGLSFFTAYELPTGGWEGRRPRIAKHYLTHWFIPDVISSIPWDLFGIIRGDSDGGPTPLLLPRYLRVLRVVKVVRLLRLMRMKQSFTWFEVRFRIRYAQVRLIRLSVSICLVAHWTACLFFFFASISPSGSPSWIEQDGIPTNRYGRYVAALYFSTKTISTVGYGDITPENTLERFYVIFLMFVGAAVFATTVSQVGSIIQDQTVSATLHRNRLDQVIELARSRNLPEKLVFDIRRFFQHRRRLQIAEGDNELLDAMSRDLRTQVLSLTFTGCLERSLLFAGEPEATLDSIYPHMRRTLHNPGEVVFNPGLPPDSLYCVISGKVQLVDELGAETILERQDVFGERDLVFGRPRRTTATCIDYCEFAVAPAAPVIDALSRDDSDSLRRLRAEECQRLWAQVFERADHELRLWRMTQKVRKAAYRVAKRSRRLQGGGTDLSSLSHDSEADDSGSDDGGDNSVPSVTGSRSVATSEAARESEKELRDASAMDHDALAKAYVARGEQLAALEMKARSVFENIAVLQQQSTNLLPLGRNAATQGT